MKEKDLFKRINKESDQGVPDVYNKILFAARAEGLLDNGGNAEVYSDGETVALGGANKKAVAIISLAALAAFSLSIALPIALSGEYDGGVGIPPVIPPVASDKPFGEDYAVGAVATAKLAESFLDEEVSEEAKHSPRTVKAASLVVNPDETGIERYVSEFENYFYACNSFFGEKPAEVEVVENHDVKYDNSIVITGKFSNGDEARYAMYYSEARILDDTTVTGDEVKYYLEGVLYLNGKPYSMCGERGYADSTKDKEKSLSFKAFPEYETDKDCVEMSVEYGTDGSVKNYAFIVVKEGKTISESVLTFPDAADGDNAAYNVEFSGDAGDKGGKFTVNRPQQGWESLIVGYEIGDLTSEFRVKATKSKLERVLAPDGLIYDDLGNGTYAITGYDKRKTMPAELFIPDEFEGKKVVKIGGSAFRECNDIKKVIIPEGITDIADFAFYKCNQINEIFFPKTLTQIDTCAFYQTGVTEINLPENLVTLNRQAFSCCDNLTSVVIPEKVETLGDQVFASCANLKTVSIPASVQSIGDGIISGTAIENITVADNSNYYYVDGGCLMERATKTVLGGSVGFVIPDDARKIGKQAFAYCMHLTELTLPTSVTEIGSLAFDNSSIQRIAMPGVQTMAYGAFYSSAIQTVEFSENLTTIDGNVFTSCKQLTALNFPASLISIDRSAFGGCYNLGSITVANGNSVYHSAGNCLIRTSTKDLVLGCYNSIIPDDGSVETIAGSAFSGQVQLTEIVLPQSLLNIEDGAFYDCFGLANVVIPDKVTRIGSFAFEKCSNLVSVTLPGSLTRLGNGAFQNCNSLKSVTIPEEIVSLIIDSHAFNNCSSLTGIVFPGSVAMITGSICKDCISLEKVNLSSSVTRIDEQAFYGCRNLNQITFEGTVEQWKAVQKGDGWDWDTGNYIVKCSDGFVTKDGNLLN